MENKDWLWLIIKKGHYIQTYVHLLPKELFNDYNFLEEDIYKLIEHFKDDKKFKYFEGEKYTILVSYGCEDFPPIENECVIGEYYYKQKLIIDEDKIKEIL